MDKKFCLYDTIYASILFCYRIFRKSDNRLFFLNSIFAYKYNYTIWFFNKKDSFEKILKMELFVDKNI